MAEDSKYKMYAANSAMPGMFVYFAKHCHIHSGLRLLKRAIRHAMDPLMPDFMKENVSIGMYNDKLFLDLDGSV